MLFKIISYLRFLLKSTNQHGVHSPFVYNLVTTCFYNRKQRASYHLITSIYTKNKTVISLKNAKLLNRLLPYLDHTQLLIMHNSSDFIKRILSVDNPMISVYYTIENQNPFDFFYINIIKFKNDDKLLETIFSLVQNDSLLLLDQIHTSQSNESIWKQIQNDPRSKVTIDTYNFGFVFFRKEQEKEHFIIRI
ncbi:hypothetical protein ACWGOQ_0011815 [Aquimarina sp. M1]